MSDGRRKNGQFEAGHKFSPGRKLGQRPKRSIFEEQLLTREPELTRAILDHAMTGNSAAVQAVAKLLAPSRRRWRSEPLRMPEVRNSRDVIAALTWTVGLVAAGEVSEHEGQVLIAAYDMGGPDAARAAAGGGRSSRPAQGETLLARELATDAKTSSRTMPTLDGGARFR